jgi:glycosyltransferase involved in cell wall biosynthesis
MPERTPTVAVIVPVRNGADTIATCIEALLALEWPADALELVIVDNGSTDGTPDVVRRYPVRLVEEHSRPSSYAARNGGIAATRGAVCCFTDADCVPAPGWVRAHVAALADPETCGSAGPIEAWRAESVVERWQARRALRADRAFRHPVLPFAQTANAAYRRDDVVRVGGFDADVVFGGDLDLAWRLQRHTGRRLAWPATRWCATATARPGGGSSGSTRRPPSRTACWRSGGATTPRIRRCGRARGWRARRRGRRRGRRCGARAPTARRPAPTRPTRCGSPGS